MLLTDLPEWASLLKNYYVVIRIENRNKTIVRRYYRLVSKEKYRLACLGIDQQQITAVCRYLASLKHGYNGSLIQSHKTKYITAQLTLDFT